MCMHMAWYVVVMVCVCTYVWTWHAMWWYGTACSGMAQHVVVWHSMLPGHGYVQYVVVCRYTNPLDH